MKNLIPILLIVGFLSTSCAAIRGLGLSDSSVDGIRDILVSEAANKAVEAYCKRPPGDRVELGRTLLKSGVNLTAIKC